MASRRLSHIVLTGGASLVAIRCALVLGITDVPPVAEAGADAGADAAVDAMDDGPRCDPKKPFGAPQKLPLSSAVVDEINPRLSADERTLYFCKSELANAWIYFIERPDKNVPFGTNISKVPGVFTVLSDAASTTLNNPFPASDGVRLYYDLFPGPIGGIDHMYATRPAAGLPYDNPTALPLFQNVNTPDVNSHLFLTNGERTLFSMELRDASPRIVSSTRTSQTSFSTPSLVAEIAATDPMAIDGRPVLTPDGLIIYFRTTRAGRGETWRASRQKVEDPFGQPSVVNDFGDYDLLAIEPGWVSADDCVIYLAGRPPNGDFDLYVSTRSK